MYRTLFSFFSNNKKTMKTGFVITSDNEKIAFNHYQKNKNEVLIIAHGWSMSKDSAPFLSMSEDFNKNFDVITFDFRGHGKSSGWFTFTSKESKDFNAIIEFAQKKYSKISILGFSLGAALAIIQAANNNNVKALIAISSPSDFYKIENHDWRPESILHTISKINIQEKRKVRPGNIFLKKIKPIDVVHKISAPSLFITGGKDLKIYPWHSEVLYNKANCKKSYVLFKDDYHAEDIYLQSRKKFLRICNNWIAKH